MAGNFTNYFEQQILQYYFGDTSYTPPGTYYIALSTTTPSQVKGSSAPLWNFTEPIMTTSLTAATGTSAITSVSVQSTPIAIANGDTLQLNDGAGHTQNITVNHTGGYAAGSTSITVNSFTPSVNYPANSTGVSDTTQANYLRVAVTNNNTNWVNATSEPTDGFTQANGTTISFAQCSGASWGTITYFGIADAPGGGNLLGFGSLTTQQVVNSGDTLSFAAQAMTLNFT